MYIPDVPFSLVKCLFPHPDLSVSRFLDFPLPIQHDGTFGVVHINAKDFWSTDTPNPLDESFIPLVQKLPVPSPQMLDLCRKEIDSAPDQLNIKSVIYTHLPSSHAESSRPFPLWTFSYWLQVSQLRRFVRIPWRQAENWSAHQDLICFPERAHLANAVSKSLDDIAWAGRLLGFPDPEPLVKLAQYLSNKWLTTTHIEQQIHLLRLRLDAQYTNQSYSSTYEIVGTQFFPKIINLFRHSRASYTQGEAPGGARHVHALGERLADLASKTTVACGVFNVCDSHWVAMAVDIERHMILYGDSMEPNDSVKREAIAAVEWWVTTHVVGDFVHVDLPITRQVDSFSCGVFAVNSVQHLVFPKDDLLSPQDAITERYKWFIAAVNQHNEVVSYLDLFCFHLY